MEKIKDDDEKKMQEFFALVRNSRDAHEHLMAGANKLEVEREKKKTKEHAAAWKPSFQPEDFTFGGGIRYGGPHGSLQGPSRREHETKEEDKGGDHNKHDLDLNLSL